MDGKVLCKACEAILGAVEGQMWKLNKWKLARVDGETRIAFPLECFLAAQFIALSEEGGVRRLLVTDESEPDRGHGCGLKVPSTFQKWHSLLIHDLGLDI